MERELYPTDLIDDEWEQVQHLVISYSPIGRKRKTDEREILNAILYFLKTDCGWRMLPHDLPSWSTVYYYYNRWEKDGTLSQIRTTLGR